PRFEFYLEKKGHDIKQIRERIDERVNKEVQSAVDFAEASPWPEPQEALEDIYAPPAAANSGASTSNSTSAGSANSSPAASSKAAQ
ncbi:MAG TPA: hypothetical protein VLI44_03580, partial [Sporolactobacillaceae bacterium]|nr:hypothetical protein [Sporolactobacillaceae bacterium]